MGEFQTVDGGISAPVSPSDNIVPGSMPPVNRDAVRSSDNSKRTGLMVVTGKVGDSIVKKAPEIATKHPWIARGMGKAGTFIKVGGFAAAAVTAHLEGVKAAKEEARSGHRGRSVCVGATTAACTLGGAVAGLYAGAAIGSFIPIPVAGTAAGAIVGFTIGAVGSVGGAYLGSWLGRPLGRVFSKIPAKKIWNGSKKILDNLLN